MKKKVIIFNENGSERWLVDLIENKETNLFEVNDDSKYSLFSNPLAVGKTAGEALDNFMLVETQLINSL